MDLVTCLLQIAFAVMIGVAVGWHQGRSYREELRRKTWFAACSQVSQIYGTRFGLEIVGLIAILCALLLTPLRWYLVPGFLFIGAHSGGFVKSALKTRGFYDLPKDYLPRPEDEDSDPNPPDEI